MDLARDRGFFDRLGREVGVLDVGADLLDDLRAYARRGHLTSTSVVSGPSMNRFGPRPNAPKIRHKTTQRLL